VARVRRRRQRRAHRGRAAQQAHLAQLGPGAVVQQGGQAQRVEQRQRAGGDALAAHLAARKGLAFHQRHPPAGAREQGRGGGARRAGADDQRVQAAGGGCGGGHQSAFRTRAWTPYPAPQGRAFIAPPAARRGS
jgi:hypothetical protein